MHRNLRTILPFMFLLIFPVAGYIWGIMLSKGVLVKWESLGLPPETPTRFIAGYVGDNLNSNAYKGRETKIYVEGVKGNIYQCCSGDNLFWTEVRKSEVKELNWTDCLINRIDKGVDKGRKHIENEIDNYAIYWCGEFDSGRVYYAIDNRGTVWVWKSYSHFPNDALLACFFMIVGLLLAVIILIIQSRSSKTAIHNENS